MERRLFICCDKENLQRFTEKVRKALGNSVKVVENVEQADLVYAIGEISPGMQQQLDHYSNAGIHTVHVNENLINECAYENALNYKKRDVERER